MKATVSVVLTEGFPRSPQLLQSFIQESLPWEPSPFSLELAVTSALTYVLLCRAGLLEPSLPDQPVLL